MAPERVQFKITPEMDTVFNIHARLMDLTHEWELRKRCLRYIWTHLDYNKDSTNCFVDLYDLISPFHDEVRRMANFLNLDDSTLVRIGLKTRDWYHRASFSPERVITELNGILKELQRAVHATVQRQQAVIDRAYSLPVFRAEGRCLSEFCVACADDFQEADVVMVLPCGHLAHHVCLADSLLCMPFCPADRRSIMNGRTFR